MAKTNPLVKKGIPTFKKDHEENHEQLVHPVIEEMPKVEVSTDIDTNPKFENVYVPPVKIKNKQVSIYLDEDVITALNKFGKEYGKGAKSELVNNFLKQYFNIRQGEQS